MFIEFNEHYHNKTLHRINVLYTLPYTWFTTPASNIHSTTVGGETYKWCYISYYMKITGDPAQFHRAQGPGTNMFPPDTSDPNTTYRYYTRMDFGKGVSTNYFRIQSDNASSLRDFRINNTQICEYVTFGMGQDNLLFALLRVNGEDGIAITDYETNGDTYSFVWFSLNCFSAGVVKPYDNDQPETQTGDDGSGGIGSGLKPPDSTPPSDTHTWVTTPLGHGINAWAVGEVAVGNLMDFLWGRGSSNAFDAGGLWQKWLNYKFNPIGAIISLHKLPDELSLKGAVSNISLAGFTFDGSASVAGVTIGGNAIGSGLSTAYLYAESATLDFPYGSYKDFSRTSVELYVPYCGTMSVDPSVCIGGKISLTYQCDNITGSLAVQVGATNRWGQFQVIGVMTGNCAYKVPLTGNDNGVGAGISAWTGGLSSIVTGNLSGAISAGAQFAGIQHHTQIAGDVRGNVGILTHQTAFVQITYGRYLDTVGNYNDNLGRPSYCSAAVKAFSGFSQLIVHADAVDIATDAERQEIEQICREGVYI
jgi:hypothetical protein